MLSLSMSFLLWSWTRSRGSWAIHRRGRAEKPAKNTDLASTRPAVLVERGRGRKQALTRARTWVESILLAGAGGGYPPRPADLAPDAR